jgi:PAS domain S-box-containing protein
MFSKGSRMPPWLVRTYPYQFLIFLTFIIIFGVTFRIAYSHYEDAVDTAIHRNKSIARASARVILDYLEKAIVNVRSYASRPLIIKSARNKDSKEIILHLASLKNDDPEVDMVFVTDRNGTLWANFPVAKETHGKSFSQSDWYRHASQERESYLSNVYAGIEGRGKPAIVACSPILDMKGEVIGILAVDQRIALMRNLADGFIWDPDLKMSLIDQAGRIIYSNRYDGEKKITYYPFSRWVKKAMEEGKGDRTVEDPFEGGEIKYLAFEPIKGIGWSVIVEKKKKEIFNSVIGKIVEYSIMALLLFGVFVLSLGYFRKVLVSRQLADRKQAQEALFESERRFRDLFDEAPVGYHELDLQGRIIRVNNTELKMLGYTAEEMLGQYVWIFMKNKEESRQAFAGKITGAIPPGRGYERTIRGKDGTFLPILVEDRIFRNHKGQVTGYRSTIQDISERKRAEEALREREREAQRLAKENAVMAAIGRNISLNLNIEKVYNRFAEEVSKLIPFDRIAISVINYENNTFTIPYNAGLNIPGRRRGDAIPLGGTTTGEVARSQCGLLVREENREELMSRIPGVLFLFQKGFRSLMSIPLISKDQVIGALVLQSINPNAYTERDLGLAMRVGTQIAGVIANAQLFLERKQAEEVLREAEEKFRLLFEISTDAVLIRDRKGIIRLANPAAVKVLKASGLDEIMGKVYLDFIHPEDRPGSIDRIQRMTKAAEEEPGADAGGLAAPLREHRMLTLGGETIYVESTGTAFRHQDQVWVQGLFHDITDRKRVEEDLRKREEEARKLAHENAIVGKIGRIISSSFSIEEVYKLFAEEVKDLLSFDRIAISIIDAEKNSLVDLYVEGIPVPGKETGQVSSLRGTLTEAVIQAEKGLMIEFEDEDEVAANFPGLLSVFTVGLRSFLSVPLISRNQVVGALHLLSRKYKAYAEKDLRLAECVANQIAGAVANARLFLERKRAEEQLKASLKEKEILLREIHHRVKNNLQIISSLLRLQSRNIGDDAISRYFKESQDRVRTMAIIHERLYQSSDLARVDFAEYIKDLTVNLYRSYGVSRETIGLRIHVNNLFLDIDMANPCGLIINELVSNSLKYAFPGGERGEIFIDLRSDHDQIILTVGDNGGAFPKELDFRRTQSLGLQLVISLVEQLEGTIELHSDGKTEFRIAFPARRPV